MNERSARRRSVHSAGAGREAFTLIELLVVIAIVALLMAILVPTLRRVRKQSREVVCRSQLRQWGTLAATQISENNGRFVIPPKYSPYELYWLLGEHGGSGDAAGYDLTEGIRCCPMATEPAHPTAEAPGDLYGGTFLAWGPYPRNYFTRMARWEDGPNLYGSYGWNKDVGPPRTSGPIASDDKLRRFLTPDVRGANSIPAQSDSGSIISEAWGRFLGPPKCDAIPTLAVRVSSYRDLSPACINRHDGGINILFLDWSARKVGLKELWTLRWNKLYRTKGGWGKTSGIRPEDWPEWMRDFKDY